MPYQVMCEPRGAYTRYCESVTGTDMLENIEDVCRHDRFEQHCHHILDLLEATDFSAPDKEMLINCGVLVGAAFVNHKLLVAAVVTREYLRAALERHHALGVPPLLGKAGIPRAARTGQSFVLNYAALRSAIAVRSMS